MLELHAFILQVASASNFKWPFANNTVTGQLSSPQEFARDGTRASDWVSDGRKGSLMSSPWRVLQISEVKRGRDPGSGLLPPHGCSSVGPGQ